MLDITLIITLLGYGAATAAGYIAGKHRTTKFFNEEVKQLIRKDCQTIDDLKAEHERELATYRRTA